MKSAQIFFFCFCLLLSSCGDQKIDTTKAREEMEAREIKVVSEAQIIDQAEKLGNTFSEQLSVSKESGEFQFNWPEDSPFEISYYLFESEEEPEGKAQALFQAYQYNKENGITSESNVQKLENGTKLLFTSPILFEGESIGMWALVILRKEVVLSIEN